VSPIAARAIAHPNSFIITPIDSVAKEGPPMDGRSEFGGLIGGTFQSLKRWWPRNRGGPISGREIEGDKRDGRGDFGGIPRCGRAARGPFHFLLGAPQPSLPAMRSGADGPGPGRTAGAGARRQASC